MAQYIETFILELRKLMTKTIKVDLLDDIKAGNSGFFNLLDLNNWNNIINRFGDVESPNELIIELIDEEKDIQI